MYSLEITSKEFNGYTSSPDCYFDFDSIADIKVFLMDYVRKNWLSDSHFVYETVNGDAGVVKLNDARIFTYMIFSD